VSGKTYEPKAGSEGVVIEAFIAAREVQNEDGTVEMDRKPGETFKVGSEDWPYLTDHAGEQAFLEGHPLVQEAEAKEEPKSRKAEKASKEGGE
jgi:hypothetical protein